MRLSATKIGDFKCCRRMYYFKYIEELLPIRDTLPLEQGKSYHDKIEQIYSKGWFTPTGDKTDAMAMAYEKYIYPKFKVKSVEDWFSIKVGNHNLVGRYDGIAEDGTIVEHKTTSMDADENYEYKLAWNEQILCYMLAKGINKMYYTVCKKPTLRQLKNETLDEYITRCCNWYDIDTDKKIRVIQITRTQEEIDEFREHLKVIGSEMVVCEHNQNLLYRNPQHCNQYNSLCPYASVCLNYKKGTDYVGFINNKKEKEKKDELF